MKYRMKAVIFDIMAECRELKKELSAAGIIVIVPFFGNNAEQTLAELLSGTELSFQDCLMLTNCEQHAKVAMNLGAVVLGCMEKEFDVPKKVPLLESPEEVSLVYLNQEYCHHLGLPAVILETERCILQEMTEKDAEAMYTILSESEVACFLPPLGEKNEEMEKITAYIRLVYPFFGYGYWGVFLKENGRLIGRAGFKEGSFPMEAGYVIQRSEWGKGLATEVLQALLIYAEEELACDKLVVKIHKQNKASLRVAEKCGFLVECSEERMTESAGEDIEGDISVEDNTIKMAYYM